MMMYILAVLLGFLTVPFVVAVMTPFAQLIFVSNISYVCNNFAACATIPHAYYRLHYHILNRFIGVLNPRQVGGVLFSENYTGIIPVLGILESVRIIR